MIAIESFLRTFTWASYGFMTCKCTSLGLESILELLDTVLGLVNYFIQIIDHSVSAEDGVVIAYEFFDTESLCCLQTLSEQLNVDPLGESNKYLSYLENLASQ